jgi:hypothetical protein
MGGAFQAVVALDLALDLRPRKKRKPGGRDSGGKSMAGL